MISPTAASELAKAFIKALPSHFQSLHHSTLEQLKPMLENWIREMPCVTREEFERQNKVLERAQKQLEMLQARVLELSKENV